jgi:hypothetical protein
MPCQTTSPDTKDDREIEGRAKTSEYHFTFSFGACARVSQASSNVLLYYIAIFDCSFLAKLSTPKSIAMAMLFASFLFFRRIVNKAMSSLAGSGKWASLSHCGTLFVLTSRSWACHRGQEGSSCWVSELQSYHEDKRL